MSLGFRQFLSLLALVSLDCVGVESAKPNVLFLAVDDMKDWVGCLGGGDIVELFVSLEDMEEDSEEDSEEEEGSAE